MFKGIQFAGGTVRYHPRCFACLQCDLVLRDFFYTNTHRGGMFCTFDCAEMFLNCETRSTAKRRPTFRKLGLYIAIQGVIYILVNSVKLFRVANFCDRLMLTQNIWNYPDDRDAAVVWAQLLRTCGICVTKSVRRQELAGASTQKVLD